MCSISEYNFRNSNDYSYWQEVKWAVFLEMKYRNMPGECFFDEEAKNTV